MSRVFRLVGSLLLVVLVCLSTGDNVGAIQAHQAVLQVRPGERAKVRVKVTNDPKALVQELELEASSTVLSRPTSTAGGPSSAITQADGSYNCGGSITAKGAFNRDLWRWTSSQDYRISQGNLFINTHRGTATVWDVTWRYDHASYSGSQSSPTSPANITSLGFFSQGSPGGVGTTYMRGRVQYFIQTSTGCQVAGDILNGW